VVIKQHWYSAGVTRRVNGEIHRCLNHLKSLSMK